jgi:uncharacterized membrane protein
MAKTICKEAIMRNLGYILLSISILLITIGIILQMIKTNCDNKTPKEYFESEICQNVGNSRK